MSEKVKVQETAKLKRERENSYDKIAVRRELCCDAVEKDKRETMKDDVCELFRARK